MNFLHWNLKGRKQNYAKGFRLLPQHYDNPPTNNNVHTQQNFNYSWFRIFAVFRMLYSFFSMIPRRMNFMCRRFVTLCSIFIFGVSTHHLWRRNWQCLESQHIKFRRRWITQKREYNIIYIYLQKFTTHYEITNTIGYFLPAQHNSPKKGHHVVKEGFYTVILL